MPNYEIIEFEGRPARRYPDGSIRNERGQLMKLHPGMVDTQITPETAPAFAKRRKEKIREAISEGLIKVTDAPDEYEAISLIVQKRAEVALKDEGRAGNDAAKLVLAAVDALPERRVEATQVQRHEYSVDEETMRVIEQMLAVRRGDVIEAEISE